MKRCILSISGGLDSSTLLHYIKKELKYDEIYALTYFYGQRHSKEIELARYQCGLIGVKEHKLIDISFLKEMLKTSALTNDTISMPGAEHIGDPNPPSYVPNR